MKFHKCDNPDCIATTDALHIPLNPIYKVVIGEDTAANIESILWDYLAFSVVDIGILELIDD